MDIKTQRRVIDAFRRRWDEVYACERERDYPGERQACRDIEVMRETLDLLGVEWVRLEAKAYDAARRSAGKEVE